MFSHLVQQVYIIPIELNSVVDVAELMFALRHERWIENTTLLMQDV